MSSLFIPRSILVRDLKDCFQLLDDRDLYDDQEQKDLMRTWTHLLNSETAISGVVEDYSHPSHPIMAFGMGIFVEDWFVTDIQREYIPKEELRISTSLAKFFLKKHMNGPTPIFSQSKRDRIHKRDMNFIVLHFSIASHLNDEEHSAVILEMGNLLFTSLAGFNLRSMVKEVYGEEQYHTHLGYGLMSWEKEPREQTSYSTKLCPYVVGIFHKEVMARGREAFRIRDLFVRQAQTWHFSRGESRVLEALLLGTPRKELARVLAMEEQAIKATLGRIYDRVRSNQPALFAHDGNRENSRRGTPKMSLVIEFVRYHTEVLRPPDSSSS